MPEFPKTHQKLSTLEVLQNQIVNIFFIYSYFYSILTQNPHFSLLLIKQKNIYYIYIYYKKIMRVYSKTRSLVHSQIGNPSPVINPEFRVDANNIRQ